MGATDSTVDRLVRWTVRPFARHQLAIELPGLPEHRCVPTLEFVEHRVTTMPSITRLGVVLLSCVLRPMAVRPVVGWLAAHPLPLIGEYPRLIRSLAVTFVWERWPDTAADGSPTDVQAAA